MLWAEVAKHFAWDGGLRDIIVPGSSVVDWDRFLQAMANGSWTYCCYRNGELGILPGSTAEVDHDIAHAMIVDVLDKGLKCHFWTDGEIELDFVPTDISGQPALDQLKEFCFWLAATVGKPVRVTEENDPDAPILEFRPDKSAEYLGKEL
ncbi:hypothetical protein FQ775_05725 [Nitratireductor mangrovi]|uniref:Uncharacterized protein n=1 Tax=Nitratireductor mangrovi TaxID=2599600 RepID=A0A5B8KWG3_9HYPH|nr:hypothetical protein [Nitratireductor mangrovi]QDY99910.1 hypothetical protein FQ775_05725 [Nitratireductor mangrovi]